MLQKQIGKILPNDGYIIALKGSLTVDYLQALTHLYQPLVGYQAVMLYQTMLTEAEVKLTNLGPKTHHFLMNVMNTDLDKLYQARIKLEAIGLLKTYVEEDENKRLFHYRLLPPFSIKEFFQDHMLALLLEHHLGKNHYQSILEVLNPEEDETIQNYKNNTRSFEEVFTFSNAQSTNVKPSNKPKENNLENKPNDPKQVDFSWLKQSLEQQMFPAESILTKDHMEFIESLAKIYQLTTLELEKAVMWAVNEDYHLNKQELKEACHDLFSKKYKQTNPLLVERTQPEKLQEVKTPQNKEEKFIHHLETISPRELLEDFSNKGQASDQEVKMIIEVMDKHGLPPGVMNVLIHYVMLKTDMKLTRKYLETIATHWGRLNISTVRDAMQVAKKQNTSNQPGAKKGYSRQRKSNEVLPDWFKSRKKEAAVSDEKQADAQSAQDIEREKEELAKALKNISSKSPNNSL